MDGFGALGESPVTNYNLYTSSLTLIATDSRGLFTNLTKTQNFVNYFTPSLSFDAFRTTPTDSEIKVNFQGTFYNGSFGSQNNTLTLGWKYRIKGTENWTNGGTLVLNTDYKISGNTFYSGDGSSAEDIILSSSLPVDAI